MITLFRLMEAGFFPVKYEGQAGEFLAKTVKVERLPYSNEHLVDGDYIFGDMLATTEVIPDGRVQLCISDADYVEGPHAFDSEEGQALLKDAIAAGYDGLAMPLYVAGNNIATSQ